MFVLTFTFFACLLPFQFPTEVTSMCHAGTHLSKQALKTLSITLKLFSDVFGDAEMYSFLETIQDYQYNLDSGEAVGKESLP